jgi:hypothetical protein
LVKVSNIFYLEGSVGVLYLLAGLETKGFLDRLQIFFEFISDLGYALLSGIVLRNDGLYRLWNPFVVGPHMPNYQALEISNG